MKIGQNYHHYFENPVYSPACVLEKDANKISVIILFKQHSVQILLSMAQERKCSRENPQLQKLSLAGRGG